MRYIPFEQLERLKSEGKTTVVFTGTFDPVTRGHEDILRRATALFGTVVIAMLNNPDKKTLFSAEDRVNFLIALTFDMRNVVITTHDGLAVEVAEKCGAVSFIRGIRNVKDYLYEDEMAVYNMTHGGVETLFLPAEDYARDISSTAARALLSDTAQLKLLLPDAVYPLVIAKLK